MTHPQTQPLPSASTMSQEERIASLERRLARERAARKAAEQIISDRSRERHLMLQSMQSAFALLQIALDRNQEYLWQWRERDRLFGPALEDSGMLHFPWAGHEGDFVSRLHPDDGESFAEAWEEFLAGEVPLLDLDLRFMGEEGDWRAWRMRAAAVERDRQSRVMHAIGLLLALDV
jgi:hypothetical protein